MRVVCHFNSGSRQKEKEINYESVKSKKLDAYSLCVLCGKDRKRKTYVEG